MGVLYFSNQNTMEVEAIKDAIKNVRRRSFKRRFNSKPYGRQRAVGRTKETSDWHRTGSGNQSEWSTLQNIQF